MLKRFPAAVVQNHFRLLAICFLLALGFLEAPFRESTVRAQTEQQQSPTLTGYTENFDDVIAPALPVGWTTVITNAGTPFVTKTDLRDTAPNAVYTTDPATTSSAALISPPIRIGGNSPKLIFRHAYNTENSWDGGVLEIKIGSGEFQDILAAGGTFVQNGYRTTPLNASGNPINGRRAWTGISGGNTPTFITTEIDLPAAAYRQTIQFRWLHGSDASVGVATGGWWIDTVYVTNSISGENQNAISIPANGAAQPYPSEIQITNHVGLVSGVTVNLNNFSHTAPDDVDLMLVAPNGRTVILMSDAGGTNPVSDVSLTFDDASAVSLPDNTAISSGVYKPANYEPGDAFPAPAPSGTPSGAMLSAFNGSEPNGTWQLYLVDDNGGNAGSLAGGWSITLQTSNEAIGIPESGAALPYPAQVIVSGQQGSVTKAVVKLKNFSHTAPDDVDVMLVAPNGRRVVLMSDAGGTTEVGGVNLTFDDAAATNLPDNSPLVSGNYKPTDYEPGDAFPAPAPSGAPSGTTLNAFYGSRANGVWKLYIVDDTGANFGSVADGFSLEIQSSTSACAFTLAPTGQGFPTSGGTGSFTVNMPAGCPWTASTTSTFVGITSSAEGEGAGAINFTVSPNLGGGRTASIVVSNGVSTQTFLIQQPSGCPFALSNTVQNVSAAGGAQTISVSAGAACGYQATSSVPWIQIVSGAQTGNGTVSFNVSPNTTSTQRSGTITVGAQTLTVNQAGASARRFDFDGDGKADVSVFRPSDGTWYVLDSQNNSFAAAQFGLGTDKLVPADYDGDRKTDFAVFRSGVWYILNSQTNSVSAVTWGASSDIPVAGDYDGDGRADVAVFRPSDQNWYIIRSSNAASQAVNFGAAGDKPVPADYDGDGRIDLAVYRGGASSSSWFVLQSGNSSVISRSFGTTNDIAVPADYDSDGRDNFAVFRPSTGTWYYAAGDGTSNYSARQFGQSGDIPVAADYNGDGRADIGVFRNGVWYILLLGSDALRTEQWGLPSDTPVSAVYNQE